MNDAASRTAPRAIIIAGPPKPKPIRYAIYTRQSIERLADFSSYEAQFHTCRDLVSAFSDPRLHWYGQRFDDVGQSGSTLDRPAMQKLRKVVDLGGIDRIYAVALDRVTRSMRDAIVLLDEFDKAGVDVLSELMLIRAAPPATSAATTGRSSSRR